MQRRHAIFERIVQSAHVAAKPIVVAGSPSISFAASALWNMAVAAIGQFGSTELHVSWVWSRLDKVGGGVEQGRIHTTSVHPTQGKTKQAATRREFRTDNHAL